MERDEKINHIISMQKEMKLGTISSECSTLAESRSTVIESLECNQGLPKNQRDERKSFQMEEKYVEIDDALGRFRNGCDMYIKQAIYNKELSSRFNNIHMGAEVQTEPESDQLSSKIGKKKISVDSINKQSTVIFHEEHKTCTSNKSIAESGLHSQNSSILGKKNVSVHVLCEELPPDEYALDIACQIQNTPLLLHAFATRKNHPHSESNKRYKSHNFTCELTNALSSELVVNFPQSAYSSYITSLSQNKLHHPFLKSQSLDILEDPQNTHETDELVFLHIPAINEDEEQQKVEFVKQDETVIQQCVQKSQVNHKTAWDVIKTQSLDSRPIYPNVPYSPYSSPRSNRRRPPLRESRRISIERSGSFLQLNQYKLMDQIGQGSYGLVKLAYSEEDSTHYAMKILSKRRLLRQAGLMKKGPKKGTSPLDRVYREIAVLKKLDHPNVVKLIEVLDDPIEDSLYMVFELVQQGEVLSIPTKKPLTEDRAWSVFRDTLQGLEYLHYQKIIHADIKPGNLLLTECGRVKIADLGVCNEFIGEDSTMTNVSTGGTPAFRAPETLNVGQNIYCGKAADIWALGATLFALVYGNVPFEAKSVPVLYEMIKNNPLRFPDNITVSSDLKDCIQNMLIKNPGNRITLFELKMHPWVTAFGCYPLPSEDENCRLVQINDEDINSVVRSIPKLDTLILIKTMLKKHSFGNPFSRGISGCAPQRGGSRMERFVRAGRSNSAPGAYPIEERQLSSEYVLPALTENDPLNFTSESNNKF